MGIFKQGILGESIRHWRKESGLKVMDLAAHCGVDPAYITQIEKGKKLPSPEVMRKIAKRLGVIDLLLIYVQEKYPDILGIVLDLHTEGINVFKKAKPPKSNK